MSMMGSQMENPITVHAGLVLEARLTKDSFHADALCDLPYLQGAQEELRHQTVYLFLLRAGTDDWSLITKIFNFFFHRVSNYCVPRLKVQYKAPLPGPKATIASLRGAWAAQTMFPRETESLKTTFRGLADKERENNDEIKEKGDHEGRASNNKEGKEGSEVDEEDEVRNEIFTGQGVNRYKRWDLLGLLRVIRRVTQGLDFDTEVIYQAWLDVLGIEDDGLEDHKFLQL